jgi:hypothetical protein
MKLSALTGRVLVLGAAVAVVSGSAVALATGGNDPNIYKACVKSSDKTLYNVLVNPRSGPSCRSNDKMIVWNEQGPVGPRGPRGYPGEDGASGLSTLTIVTEPGVADPTDARQVGAIVDCPAGSFATGGGYLIGATNAGYAVVTNIPFGAVGTPPTGWAVRVVFEDSAGGTMTGYAVCASGVTAP